MNKSTFSFAVICIMALVSASNLATAQFIDYDCCKDFDNTFELCVIAIGNVSGSIIQNEVEKVCMKYSSDNAQLPDPGPQGTRAVSLFQSVLTPTGTLAVTTWAGQTKDSGERAVVQITTVVGILVTSIICQIANYELGTLYHNLHDWGLGHVVWKKIAIK
ncbi:hypothetical protein BC938DRAFT_475513 [Jimgerdemannia flammicorona]|uniref:Uncharacterized protein n=1 Tax=Jimgerdemannia flammicorona TaxID=994334 RepID=A0A433QZG1_9FUNG|nr:hypothetical protein BC938DRAFT_475513 [Jimgerdemannia flammicorona]